MAAAPRGARAWPRRRVLALGIERTGVPNVLDGARTELLRSHHDVEVAVTDAGATGANSRTSTPSWPSTPADGHDWLLVIDDDVRLPRGFLDVFLFLAERFDLSCWPSPPTGGARMPPGRSPGAGPASWPARRDSSRSARCAPCAPTPSPSCSPSRTLRFGWGLDAHWSAVAAARGWRIGVIDATPVLHGLRRIAASYDRTDAVTEGRSFLADRPYTPAAEAQRTVVAHRRWR